MPGSTFEYEGEREISAVKRPASAEGVTVPAKLCKKAEITTNGSANGTNGQAAASSLDKDQIMDIRRKHIGPNVPVFFPEEPLHIVRGSGQYFYDDKGQRILDCINNVCHVGHCHPHVVERAQKQMAILNTNSRYLHEEIVTYAKRLTDKLPEPLSVCYFCCTGSEANELAARLARAHTGGREIIAVDAAYHGHTQLLIDFSSYKHNHPGYTPGCGEHASIVSAPCTYRGAHRDPATAGELYAAEIKDAITKIKGKGEQVSAFFCEGLMSCGGQIVLPDGYLKHAYKHVRDAGGLCVADEVQVGFGRVGTHFWAFETQDVVPDIVTMGKPIGNGHPLAVVVTTPEIAASFAKTTSYFNTYGGNPVSGAVANAVMDVIEKEHLQEHALRVGQQILEGYEQLKKKHILVGDIRGSGLMLGLDLVVNRDTREPATTIAGELIHRMKNQHILVSQDGPDNNVIKLKPPMCFSSDDAILLLSKLDEILGQLERENGFPALQ